MNAMSHPFDLTGRIVLVTGASSGIGKQICISVAAMGGQVIATGRNEERLHHTLQLLKGDHHQAIVADLTEEVQQRQLISQLPKLHGVVHSAGIMSVVPFQFLSSIKLKEIDLVNYHAPLLLTQQILKNKLLGRETAVVFISSIAALSAIKGYSVYAGTKAGVIASARVLALEIASQGIRVNCIAPSSVKTPMLAQTQQLFSEEKVKEHEKLYPLGFGEPEDVANATIFLLSKASRWITGTTLVVDGGFSCQ